MNETPSSPKAVTQAGEATPEKKRWVTPAATVEQVSEVTKNLGGPGGDAFTCHS